MEAGVFFGVAHFGRSMQERLALLAQHRIAFGPAIPLQSPRTRTPNSLSPSRGCREGSRVPAPASSGFFARQAKQTRENDRTGRETIMSRESKLKLAQIFAVWAERQRARARVAQIQRGVLQERKQREFEKQVAIFALAQGKAPSPVPQSGVAGQMEKLLKGQALFDPGQRKFWRISGSARVGRNKSWRGPVYSEAAGATLDSTVPQAMPGRREKTASPRLRG